MDRYTQIVILCEDRQQEVFARHFLASCGVHPRRIRSMVSPAGGGAAEQYVRQRYPREVEAYRSASSHKHIGLVVMIDADTESVADRHHELEQALADAGQPRRQSQERIGIFVPKRNIETWLRYLQGEAVNEQDAYPRLGRESECKPLAAELAQNRQVPLPEDAPASWQAACDELPRILPG